MDIKYEKTGNVNALVTVTIEKSDYEPLVEKELKDLRRKASMPGFRPGQAPLGMLRKRFGTEVTAEQVNKLLGEKLYGYIREQKLNILGEPLPNEEKQPKVDFGSDDPMAFVFDVALAPEFDAKLTGKDKVPFYTIEADEKLVDQQVQMYRSRGGEYKKVDSYEAKDMVKGTLTELDKSGKKKREGLVVEDAVLLPEYMKSEEEKAKFVGAKVKDSVVFCPAAAYDGSETELASLLKRKKEEVADKKGDFRLTVTEITRYVPAELTQELFDQVLGKDVVKDEAGFRAKVKEQLESQFAKDAEFRFMQDLRAHLTKRIGALEFPDEMLKRIMRLNNKDKDEKFIEDNYEKSKEELTWHLIKEQLSDQFEVKIDQADVTETAKELTRMQFAQYGMSGVSDEVVTNYANEMLKNQQQAEGLVGRAVEKKIAAAALQTVKLDNKKVSLDEFNKLYKD